MVSWLLLPGHNPTLRKVKAEFEGKNMEDRCLLAPSLAHQAHVQPGSLYIVGPLVQRTMLSSVG